MLYVELINTIQRVKYFSPGLSMRHSSQPVIHTSYIHLSPPDNSKHHLLYTRSSSPHLQPEKYPEAASGPPMRHSSQPGIHTAYSQLSTPDFTYTEI